MISRFLALLFIILATAPSHGALFGTVRVSCELVLGTPKQLGRANGPLAPAFFGSSNLLYNDGQFRKDAFPFYASNEFDWHNTPWDDSPTDVVVGFGTNSAWDIASRKHAKLLVLGDFAAGPLIAQNFILRPMLRLSATPAEFIALVAGLELPPEHAGDDPAEIEKFVVDYTKTHRIADIHAGMHRILQKLVARGVSNDELRAIAAYYLALVNDGRVGEFGLLRSEGAETTGPLIRFFASRYFPALRVTEGMPAGWSAPNPAEDSFLSSRAAFARFRSLYGTSLYAHTDYAARDFYLKLKEHGDKFGYRRYTFSLTNIVDTSSLSVSDALATLERYRRMINEIFPRENYEVVIFLTTNNQPPHGFLRLERDTRVRREEWLRSSDW